MSSSDCIKYKERMMAFSLLLVEEELLEILSAEPSSGLTLALAALLLIGPRLLLLLD